VSQDSPHIEVVTIATTLHRDAHDSAPLLLVKVTVLGPEYVDDLPAGGPSHEPSDSLPVCTRRINQARSRDGLYASLRPGESTRLSHLAPPLPLLSPFPPHRRRWRDPRGRSGWCEAQIQAGLLPGNATESFQLAWFKFRCYSSCPVSALITVVTAAIILGN
jgi:hypothetical protein